ncbi:MAG: RNA polymerase subunit sigma-70 [Acidimicrobiales bacterium]|nr:RNA polymerase subunit sigma-70 [Acidimicrobiales bacterium]
MAGATNVCLDMHKSPQRRARPMELGPARPPDPRYLDAVGPESLWVTPVADDRVLPVNADPAEVAEARESIRLAFVTALQHLPARQRAALILCEVLRWPAAEVAELLDTTTAAINSALQRARSTLATVDTAPLRPTDDAVRDEVLERYVDAFERYDIEALVALLRHDAIQSMPPYEMWLQGAGDIGAWMLGAGIGCEGSRVVPTRANGRPAFGQYRVDPDGGHSPWALQVVEFDGDAIGELHFFLDTATLFPLFDLPMHLP